MSRVYESCGAKNCNISIILWSRELMVGAVYSFKRVGELYPKIAKVKGCLISVNSILINTVKNQPFLISRR